MSRHNKSNMSNNSEKTNKDQQGEKQVSQLELKIRRDTFLFRFKDSSTDEFKDRIVQESNLGAELDKKLSERYWQELQSISITPNAPSGLGKLITFDFVSPCFETQKPLDKEDAKRMEKMSFYGQVKFDFRQFGNDDDKLKP